MYRYSNLSPEEKQAVIQERLARGFPAHSPPHPITDARYFLITASCLYHVPIMESDARRQLVLDKLFERLISIGAELQAWVVLPNHYHLLINIEDLKILSPVIQYTHGLTSRLWNLEDHTPGRKVWYRYSDRFIRNERHYCVTLNYIHFNPLKHGYSKSPYGWKESSIHWYENARGQGWLEKMWEEYPVREFGKGWDG